MSKIQLPPVAFLSYVRSDDEHENGKISEIRKKLSAEVKMQTGDEFPIFQDRNDIAWGQNWKERLDKAIDSVTFLIPIITPSFFKSESCRDELQKFLEREKQLKRGDLILPLYYVEAAVLSNVTKKDQDELAKLIGTRQHFDWRNLRFEPLTSGTIGKAIALMATQIRDSIEQIPKSTINTVKPPRKKKLVIEEASEGSSQQEVKVIKLEASSSQGDSTPLIVDQMGKGDFATISEAIVAAKIGQKILVRAGLYNESIQFTKPLEIVGDGDREQIVIQIKDKSVVNFNTNIGRIANLTLRQLGGNFFCIRISQGRFNIEECDITSKGLTGIGIMNWADPRIRNNKIHDCKQVGIMLYENAIGSIENNDIYYNGYSAIEIKTGADPLIRGNTIRDGKASGITVHSAGFSTIEDNDIYNNLVGINIKQESNSLIRRNRIRSNRQSGIFVYDNGLSIIEENELLDNLYDGIEVRVGNPQVRRNSIIGNRWGIRIREKSNGVYENNTFKNNKRGSWDITEDSLKQILIKDNIES